jgi:restriction system protein
LLDGREHQVRELAASLATERGLTAEELAQMVPSGKMTVWRSRVHWATQYLYQARAISRSRRGVFAITDRGRQLLAQHPDRVGNEHLEQFEEFRDFKNRSRADGPRRPQNDAAPTTSNEPVPGETSSATPYERIAAAAAEANAAVAAELLQRINEQPPEFLERVVLDLLVAMGYAGALGKQEHLGRSGDEGIDGVLDQDALGLDRIYIQAKRYASGRTVGRPDIQGFVGALHGAQASRGVFITTSRFSPEARTYTAVVPQRLVLIDGDQLARLMVAHGVGVQTEQTINLKKIDEDFFE